MAEILLEAVEEVPEGTDHLTGEERRLAPWDSLRSPPGHRDDVIAGPACILIQTISTVQFGTLLQWRLPGAVTRAVPISGRTNSDGRD